MNKTEITAKFIDLIENNLSETEAAKLRQLIAENPELTASFKNYQDLVRLEKLVQEKKFELNQNFTVKVMERIQNESEPNFIRRLIMKFNNAQKIIFSGVATAAILTITLSSYYNNPQEAIYHLPDVNSTAELPTTETVTGKTNVQIKELERQVTELEEEQDEQKLALDKRIGDQNKNEENSDLVAKPENRPAEIKKSETISLENNRAAIIAKPADKSQATVGSGGQLKGEDQLASVEGVAAREIAAPKNSNSLTGGLDGAKSKQAALVAPGVAADQSYLALGSQEKYGQASQNPVIAVSDEALSTFSIDVDTGSYTNARRFLRLGQLPPADSVRTEEFLNYFKYNYPVQYEKPFNLSYEFAPAPLDENKYLLKLGIKAKDSKTEERPWHLTFLVDVSGSMATDDKLGLVKKSLEVLTNNMKSTDKVSIITYAGSAATLLEATSIKDKDKILQAIEQLTSGGGTHGSEGILTAYKIAEQHFIKNGINRVLLATDGDFNVGTTSTEELIKLITEKRKSNITLTTLGFGTGNYNEAMMEQLANKGNGNYFYMDSFKEARKVFEEDLFGTIEVVAKDVKLQIEFNPEHVSHYRLIGYDNRLLKKEEFNDDAIDAGEIGSGHTVTALYEVILNDSPLSEKMKLEYRYKKEDKVAPKKVAADLQAELGFLKVRFKEPSGNDSSLLTFPIANKEQQASADFNFAAAVSYFAELLKQSKYASKYSYADVLKLAQSNLGKDTEGYRQEFLELVKNAQALSK